MSSLFRRTSRFVEDVDNAFHGFGDVALAEVLLAR